MFMRHTTKRKILTEILNSEFDTSVIYYQITEYFNGRAPWSLQWDYFKAKTRFNRNDMTCISWYKMRQQDISLLMKITLTSGNYTCGEEKIYRCLNKTWQFDRLISVKLFLRVKSYKSIP